MSDVFRQQCAPLHARLHSPERRNRRKQLLLGIDDPVLLVEWLAEELNAKGARSRPIGFVMTSD